MDSCRTASLKPGHALRWLRVASAAALLCACAVAPLPQDQVVTLAPGQGLAAVMIDTLDPLSLVTFEQPGGGAKLVVATAPAGINIYLFPTRAGRYCMTRFQFASFDFSARAGAECFQVSAGQLSYSGTLAPRVEEGRPVTHQVMDQQGFRVLLGERYPTVAKQFPPPPPAE
ncbi:MAG TPA: hypothetical protein VH327_04320 [Gammaproteobacteria bacterium]|jgi:hypothetical protein|nr:hypothetical protein [Gammaproteobacteria bacterium]